VDIVANREIQLPFALVAKQDNPPAVLGDQAVGQDCESLRRPALVVKPPSRAAPAAWVERHAEGQPIKAVAADQPDGVLQGRLAGDVLQARRRWMLQSQYSRDRQIGVDL